MAKQAYLKIEQLAHFAPTRDNKQVRYGRFRYTVSLCFDNESKWLIGRCPDLDLYSNHESIYTVYLPSLFITRTLAVIHATKTVYNDVHVIQGLNDKQVFSDLNTQSTFIKKPLRNNDKFQIVGMPFYRFKYLYTEDKEPSGDLLNDTVY